MAKRVQQSTNHLLRMDDFGMLDNIKLTMDIVEGVFVNPPQCIPRYMLVCTSPLLYEPIHDWIAFSN